MTTDPDSTASPRAPGASTSATEHGHAAPLDYHRRLLDDPVRMDAYERAIRSLVRPGDVVLDLGAGTGILSLLAARRGARVHALESQPVASLARELARTNGLAEQIHVHRADARVMQPVEPVDLLVTDCMGRFLVDDAMLPAVAAARRWLKPDARLCPARIDLRVAPVGDLRLRAVQLFEEGLYGLDLRPARRYALNYCYGATLGPQVLLDEGALYHRWSLAEEPPPFDCSMSWTLRRDGVLGGLAGWFEAQLTPEVVLSTEPGVETHWGQYLFPLPPTRALRGDRLDVRLWLEGPGVSGRWRWTAQLERGGETVLQVGLESEQRLGLRPVEENPT